MSSILTKSLMSSAGGFETSNGVILNGNTNIIDATLERTVKWIVEIVDNTNEKVNSYEILATNSFNNDTFFNKYSMVGDKIKHIVEVNLNGSSMEINITNNELIDLTYKIARLEII